MNWPPRRGSRSEEIPSSLSTPVGTTYGYNNGSPANVKAAMYARQGRYCLIKAEVEGSARKYRLVT